jgi:hypothetical protein
MLEPLDNLSEQLRMADQLALPGAPIGRHQMGGGTIVAVTFGPVRTKGVKNGKIS